MSIDSAWRLIPLYKKQIRPFLRTFFFSFLNRLAKTDEFRSIINQTLNNQLVLPELDKSFLLNHAYQNYPELGRSSDIPADMCSCRKTIFITGRFRSGTTLLWNIFRQVQSFTAYYEPFNERRWFDPSIRGKNTDVTHIGVDNYWREYDGLEALSSVYQESWIDRDLYMSGSSWNPRMKQYIDILIERAKNIPVLQFNRIDFRLPWIKANYPDSSIIHIFRNPRDQWCSFIGEQNISCIYAEIKELDSIDRFYLNSWGEDLKYFFPFLDKKDLKYAYELFFLIWKLSYCFGIKFSDISIPFERIVDDPKVQMDLVCNCLNIELIDETILDKLVNKSLIEKWKPSISDSWFRQIESKCECLIEKYYR
ncbi:MAG: sulfotransferase [Desulfotignum sp.]|nr:sulfotransferase [Desulfotignum sp.]